MDAGASIALAVALAVCVSGALAALLRLARCPGGAPGAALLAGCVAGTLLGPGVLGRVAPDAFTALYRGDVESRARLAQLDREHEADVGTLAAVGASPAAIAELRERHKAQRGSYAHRAQRDARRRGDYLAACALAGFVLFALLATAARPKRAARAAPGAEASGIAAVVVAAGLVALAGWLFLGIALRALLAFAVACAVCGAWPDARSLRDRTGRTPAVRVAVAAGAIAGAAGVLFVAPGLETITLLLAGALGVALPAPLRLSARARRAALLTAQTALAPALVALLVVRLDPALLARDRVFWIGAVIAVILCHDGRWVGAWLAWRTHTRDLSNAWRASAGVLDANTGLTQCAAALALLNTGAIGVALAGALVVGALAVELAAPVRTRAAVWMDAWMAGEKEVDVGAEV